jgi:hypothetical protein
MPRAEDVERFLSTSILWSTAGKAKLLIYNEPRVRTRFLDRQEVFKLAGSCDSQRAKKSNRLGEWVPNWPSEQPTEKQDTKRQISGRLPPRPSQQSKAKRCEVKRLHWPPTGLRERTDGSEVAEGEVLRSNILRAPGDRQVAADASSAR